MYLAVDAAEVAAGKKHCARAASAADARFFPLMEGRSCRHRQARHSAEAAALRFRPFRTTVPRTKVADHLTAPP